MLWIWRWIPPIRTWCIYLLLTCGSLHVTYRSEKSWIWYWSPSPCLFCWCLPLPSFFLYAPPPPPPPPHFSDILIFIYWLKQLSLQNYPGSLLKMEKVVTHWRPPPLPFLLSQFFVLISGGECRQACVTITLCEVDLSIWFVHVAFKFKVYWGCLHFALLVKTFEKPHVKQ